VKPLEYVNYFWRVEEALRMFCKKKLPTIIWARLQRAILRFNIPEVSPLASF
jgi:hypothetical protein